MLYAPTGHWYVLSRRLYNYDKKKYHQLSHSSNEKMRASWNCTEAEKLPVNVPRSFFAQRSRTFIDFPAAKPSSAHVTEIVLSRDIISINKELEKHLKKEWSKNIKESRNPRKRYNPIKIEYSYKMLINSRKLTKVFNQHNWMFPVEKLPQKNKKTQYRIM